MFTRNLIVVTGGSQGIGKAIAERFAKGGFDVVISARTSKTLEATAAELNTYGVAVHAFVADLSSEAGCKHLANDITSLARPIDVLVNNAGSFLPGRLHDEPDGTLEKMLDVNLMSAYHLTRFLVPGMMARKKGHIINMCSVASIKAYPNGGAYCVAKHALYGFSKCLREEMKPHNIKVVSILPGATFTASWEASGLPEERFMNVSDIADATWMAVNLSEGAVLEEIVLRPQLGDI